MKVTTGNVLDSTKLAHYLKKQGHETVVASLEVEFLTGGDPSEGLQTELATLTQNQLDAKDETVLEATIGEMMNKHKQRVIYQSMLDYETLSQDEIDEINARIASL